MSDTAAKTCGHRCPDHPDWQPCALPPGHSVVLGHRDSAGPDMSHAWWDHGHHADVQAEDIAAAFTAAADTFSEG